MIIFKEEIPLGFHGAWLQGVRKEVLILDIHILVCRVTWAKQQGILLVTLIFLLKN